MQQLNRDIEISDAIVVEDDDNERNEGPNVASIAALIAAEDGDEDDDDGDVPPSSAPAFRKPPVPMSRRAMSASRATQQAPHPLESPAVGAMEWSTLVAERNSVGLEVRGKKWKTANILLPFYFSRATYNRQGTTICT